MLFRSMHIRDSHTKTRREKCNLKKLPKRYNSEEAVKHALKIDSFRNLSKDKVMQFASIIPDMDKEVAIAIINQFPVYADFGKAAIERYTEVCNRILENNKESQVEVVKRYQTILDVLAKRMEKEEISDQERQSITVDMIAVADKIAEADLNNKKFLDRMFSKILIAIVSVIAVVCACIGISSAFENNSSLPEIQDDEDEE